MCDLFLGHNQDVHEVVVFSHVSPTDNEGQVTVRWPNYAIYGLFAFISWKTEIVKVKSISGMKYMNVTYEYLFEYIWIYINRMKLT